MTTHDHHDNDNRLGDAMPTDDAENSTADVGAAGADAASAGEQAIPADDRPTDHAVGDDAPPLAHLLRQAGRAMRREFLGALADADIDPRDIADLRRRARRGPIEVDDWTDEEVAPVDDSLHDRVRALRNRVSAQVDEILTEDEIAAMRAMLTKLIDALGGDEESAREIRERMRGFARGRGRSRRGGARGPRGGVGPRSAHGPRGRRGFDPRDWADSAGDPRAAFAERVRGAGGRGREEAYERGFAAGFDQGRQARP